MRVNSLELLTTSSTRGEGPRSIARLALPNLKPGCHYRDVTLVTSPLRPSLIPDQTDPRALEYTFITIRLLVSRCFNPDYDYKSYDDDPSQRDDSEWLLLIDGEALLTNLQVAGTALFERSSELIT